MWIIKNKKQQEKSPDEVGVAKRFGWILIKALGVVVFLSSILLLIGSWTYAFTYYEPLITSGILATVILSVFAVLGLLPFIVPRVMEKRAKAANKNIKKT